MKKNQEITSTMVLEPEQSIIINGVVITPGFLDYIKSWRDDDNGIIRDIQTYISDGTSSLLFAMDYMNEDYNQIILNQIKRLNQTRMNLNHLMSPQEQA